MTTDTETALLAAVAAAPGDDTPRLVYADWLEENGRDVDCGACWSLGDRRVILNPNRRRGSSAVVTCPACSGTGRVSDGRREYAAFIRDCCLVLARHTDCPVRLADIARGRPVPLRCGACDYCQARRRAERYYAKHPWLPGVPAYAVAFEPTPLDGPIPDGPGATLVVRRGFVESVRLPLPALLASDTAARLGGLVGLTEIRLTDREPMGVGVRTCGLCDGTGTTPDPVVWEWVRATPAAAMSGERWYLPEELFLRLSDARLTVSTQGMVVATPARYPTRAAALDALAGAAVAYCRGR